VGVVTEAERADILAAIALVTGFARNPRVEFLPDGRRVMICRAFTFVRPNGERIHVRRDFVCDGLSQPFLLWFLKISPFTGRSRDAALVHDWLYKVRRTSRRTITRKEADLIFLEAMKARGTTWFVRRAKYLAVRWFSSWKPILQT
jgi:uncharacterized protein DUF1353